MRGPDIQISLGYGHQFNKAGTSYLNDGFSAGLNFSLGQNIEVQGVYNHHSKYYASLAIQF
jgi:hypothetical protein